ncbi:MAG: tetratricopeptide repeat protein [Candidatus Heimdallarchaeota archaeon]
MFLVALGILFIYGRFFLGEAILMSLEVIQKLIQDEKLDDALSRIEILERKDRIEGEVLKSLIFRIRRDYDGALSILEKILNSRLEQLNPVQEFGARNARIQTLYKLRRFSEITEEVEMCDIILSKMNDSDRQKIREWEGELLAFKGGFQISIGEFDKALDFFKRSLNLFREINHKRGIYYQLNNIGWILRARGSLDEAQYYIQKQLEISKAIGNTKYIAWSNYSLGYIHYYKGELDAALRCAEESFEIFDDLEHEIGLSEVSTLMGSVHQGKGNFRKGIQYYDKALKDYSPSSSRDVPHGYCVTFRYLGAVHYHQGELEKAIEYFNKAIDIHKSICKSRNTFLDFELAILHLYLTMVYVELHNEQQIDVSQQKLDEYVERWPWLDVVKKLAQALVLKEKKRAVYRFQAQQILQEIKEDKFDYEIEFMIKVNLCELLLDELKYSGEETIILDIQQLLDQISNLADKQRSITTLVSLYSLQARLSLIEGKSDLSKELLEKALAIAEDKGLGLIYSKLLIQRQEFIGQLDEWKKLFIRNSTLQERIELLNLREYISNAINDVLEDKFKTLTRFKLVYKDLYHSHARTQKHKCRIGIAQIGISETDDILSDLFCSKIPGLFNIRKEKVEFIRNSIKNKIRRAFAKGINILLFPELIVDLNYKFLREDISKSAQMYGMYIIPGSFHDQTTNRNTSIVFGPKGVLWEQEKHHPATIYVAGKKIKEGISVDKFPRNTIVCNTEYGRMAILICRDFLDLDFRAELKNFDPPVDIIFNPAFTPVTADFKAAHFDARRSIYAYCFFANIAEFGDSFIYTPEKERTEYKIPPKKEDLIYKDVDIFQLRSERKKWEKEMKKTRSFIQSTRT